MKIQRRLFRWAVVVVLSMAVGVLGASFVWRVFVRPPVEPVLDPKSERAIQVRILNAAGVPELARRVQQFLRRRGFDVVEATTTHRSEKRSYVVDHLGDSTATAQVAYVLGIEPNAVRREIDSDFVLHCSVVIGQDWQLLRPFR